MFIIPLSASTDSARDAGGLPKPGTAAGGGLDISPVAGEGRHRPGKRGEDGVNRICRYVYIYIIVYIYIYL